VKAKTVTGFEVRGGKVQAHTLYATRKDAARHLESFKGLRGFSVRYGRVVETLTTKKRVKNHHQEIGGEGRSWEDWVAPLATRREAERILFNDLRRKVAARRADLRDAERALAKAGKP